jgi:hypothetical protein
MMGQGRDLLPHEHRDVVQQRDFRARGDGFDLRKLQQGLELEPL